MRCRLIVLGLVVGAGSCSYDFERFDPVGGQGGSAAGSTGGTAGTAASGGSSGGAGTAGSAGGGGAGGSSGAAGSAGVSCTEVTINFQPAGEPVPAGTQADYGDAFGPRGQGCSYGWNDDNTANARVRGVDPDPRRDTLTHMQRQGNWTWEIEVPDGTYEVDIVAGDPSYADSVYAIEAEGVLVVDGTPTAAEPFVAGTATVQVQDGRLTVHSAGSSENNKLCYLEIRAGR